MQIEIKHWNGRVLHAVEATSLKLALEALVRSGAVLSGADLRGAVLRGEEWEGVPVVVNLHQKMLKAIEAGSLDMSSWHTCETTHCRAGWAITLAGAAGKALELGFGPAAAGALITLKSCPWMEKVPDFYARNDAALADIKACAERELTEAN